ncbi:hypothetical protein, partial [uncultured Novosphingobium sp.]
AGGRGPGQAMAMGHTCCVERAVTLCMARQSDKKKPARTSKGRAGFPYRGDGPEDGAGVVAERQDQKLAVKPMKIVRPSAS